LNCQTHYINEYSLPTSNFLSFSPNSTGYFAQDATLNEQVGDHQKTGKWHVNENGDLCVELEGRKAHCAPVMKQGDYCIRIIRNEGGRKLAQIRYTPFTPGIKQ
jgi:hypothetical protein